ncbi:hypothetical protein DIPPA_21326 [Diplonema papillatum]|nr:hypothetical protein DIPPA_21326 [Diplonema papillatum]
MPTSPSRRALIYGCGSQSGSRAVGNPNSAGPPAEPPPFRFGKAAGADKQRQVESLCSNLSWVRNKDGVDARFGGGNKMSGLARARANDSCLNNHEGFVTGNHQEHRFGRRPSPNKERPAPHKLGRATTPSRYDSSLKSAACEADYTSDYRPLKGRHRTNSPLKEDSMVSKNGALTHGQPRGRETKRKMPYENCNVAYRNFEIADTNEIIHRNRADSPTAKRFISQVPTCFVDSVKNRKGRPAFREDTVPELLSPRNARSGLSVTKSRQQAVCKILGQQLEDPRSGRGTQRAGSAPSWSRPLFNSRRRSVGNNMQSDNPHYMVFHPQPARSPSPTKSGVRQGPYHDTSRLLAWS